jgi:heme exporter protein D
VGQGFERGKGMNWNSLDEFLAMGGYGLYVWGSYGVVALCMVVEVIAVRVGYKRDVETARHLEEQES